MPLDPRHLTSHLRDISLVSEAEYQRLDAPSALQQFPEDLANPDLEYSGIYEDGWVGEKSRVALAAGGPTTLVVRAEVAPASSQRLRVTVNGEEVFSERVRAGRLELRVPLPASATRRRVALRWSTAPPLGGGDDHPAAARLELIRLVPASADVPRNRQAQEAQPIRREELRQVPARDAERRLDVDDSVVRVQKRIQERVGRPSVAVLAPISAIPGHAFTE